MGHKDSRYSDVVNLVLSKHAGRLPKQDKDDLRQEAEMVLLKATEKYTRIIPDKIVYRIVKNRVIECLSKFPPRTESLDSPDVLRKYDRQSSYSSEIDIKLDAEKAVHLVNSLSDPYRFVLSTTFGIDGNPRFTEDELAQLMNKSKQWVKRVKKQGLFKLREMMKG